MEIVIVSSTNKKLTDSVLTEGEIISSRNPVIICVGDEESNIELLEDKLVFNGYKVVTVTSGENALLKITSQTIELVLQDINMPGKTWHRIGVGNVFVKCLTGISSYAKQLI